MTDMSEAAFSIGSSLELLATVASLPNEGNNYSSQLLAFRTETPELLQPKSPSVETPSASIQAEDKKELAKPCTSQENKKSRNSVALSSLIAKRICWRLFSLRRKMHVSSARVSVNPRSVSAVLSHVEKDLTKLFGKGVFRAPRLPALKSLSCSSVRQDTASSKVTENCVSGQFVDEATQTAGSPIPALDIDNLDATVTISPVDFAVSIPFVQEHPLISPKIEHSIKTEVEASGQLLDSFLEKVELSEQSSVQSVIPETPAKVFDPKEQQLTPTFINMFWNTFPALKSDTGRVFIRLADISATAMPAKDSSILKQRCNKLSIPIYSCTDLQRNFLVNYCFGSSCRSVFMIECLAAKNLLASYCQDKMKEHGLTINDMQVVVLNEEDSQRLISSRLNLCSTKYVGNGTITPDVSNNKDNGLVLRRRIVSAPPTPPPESARKKAPRPSLPQALASCTVIQQPTEVPEPTPMATPGEEPVRQRLWSSAQIYNASVVDQKPEQVVVNKKRKRRAKDCFDISKPPKRRRLPPCNSKITVNTRTEAPKKRVILPSRFEAVLLPRSTPITVRAVGQPEKLVTTTVSCCQTGLLVPHLFVVQNAPCVQCLTCRSIMSPLAFTRHCFGKKLRPESLTGDVERKAWLKFCQKLRHFQNES